jgi:hypothetical protein
MKRIKRPRAIASPPAPKAQASRLRWLNHQLEQFVPTCPWAQGNPNECPLYKLRKKSARTVAKWIDGLTIGDKEYLVLYHQCCLATKQGRVSPKKEKAPRRKREG